MLLIDVLLMQAREIQDRQRPTRVSDERLEERKRDLAMPASMSHHNILLRYAAS